MKTLRDLFELLFYLALAAFLIYNVPASLNRIFFPLFLILFYRSKNNYIWLAFFFIILEEPSGLYSGGLTIDELRLPAYTIMPKISIGFEQLFIITALVKTLKYKISFSPIALIQQNLKRLGIYFIWLVIVTIAFGISFNGARNLYKIAVNLTLFYSMFFLMRQESDFISFFRLIFPFAFLSLALQSYSLLAGHQLITSYKPDIISTQGILGIEGINRPIEMPHLLLLSFFGSLYFLANGNKYFLKIYLVLINLVSYFAIFLTATRGWIVAFTVSYILFFLFIPSKSIKIAIRYFAIFLLALVLLFSFSIFKNQYNSVSERVSTLKLLVQGDITLGGTVGRYNIVAPQLLEAFKESTILFGAGFSDYYLANANSHIGFHNFLFNAGIVGIILLGFFLCKLIFYPLTINARLHLYNPYKGAIKVFSIAIIALMLINNMSQFFGYDVGLNRIFSSAVILFFLSNQISKALSFSDDYNNESAA